MCIGGWIISPPAVGRATSQPRLATCSAGQGDRESACRPGSGCTATRPLCVTMIFWTRASPSPVPRVVTKGRKMRGPTTGSTPGPLSMTAIRTTRCGRSGALDRDPRWMCPSTGLRRVAAEIRERLLQQHSSWTGTNSPRTVTSPPPATASARIRRALQDRPRIHGGEDEVGPSKFRKVADAAPRCRFRRGCPERRDVSGGSRSDRAGARSRSGRRPFLNSCAIPAVSYRPARGCPEAQLLFGAP